MLSGGELIEVAAALVVGAVLANIDGGCVLSFSTSLATVISDFEN
jgi:hypothetical protein